MIMRNTAISLLMEGQDLILPEDDSRMVWLQAYPEDDLAIAPVSDSYSRWSASLLRIL